MERANHTAFAPGLEARPAEGAHAPSGASGPKALGHPFPLRPSLCPRLATLGPRTQNPEVGEEVHEKSQEQGWAPGREGSGSAALCGTGTGIKVSDAGGRARRRLAGPCGFGPGSAIPGARGAGGRAAEGLLLGLGSLRPHGVACHLEPRVTSSVSVRPPFLPMLMHTPAHTHVCTRMCMQAAAKSACRNRVTLFKSPSFSLFFLSPFLLLPRLLFPSLPPFSPHFLPRHGRPSTDSHTRQKGVFKRKKSLSFSQNGVLIQKEFCFFHYLGTALYTDTVPNALFILFKNLQPAPQ